MFIDRLIDSITEKNNPTVVGLDPKVEYVPAFIKDKAYREHGVNTIGAAATLLEFNKRMIDAVYDIVPAVKPQLAYYEMYGTEGLKAFDQTVAYAHSKGLLVIADGKRNDIGSTAEAYSSAFLGEVVLDEEIRQKVFDTDALTVNPYLGIDGIKPFLEDCARYKKGIFILVKTSNKSSGQLQDLVVEGGKRIYETVAVMVDEWGNGLTGRYGYSSVGAVVGATYPEQAGILRKLMKKAYILVPGYGAQGGTANDIVPSFDENGMGAIVNASRSIMCACRSALWKGTYSEENFDQASRAEALRMKNDINKALGKK